MNSTHAGNPATLTNTGIPRPALLYSGIANAGPTIWVVATQARISPIPTEIVDAFRAVAPVIEAFARENDLLIDRYRRVKPAWELRFARRVGGEGVITISYRERTGHVLDVITTWWLDDHAAKTRRLRSAKIGVYDRRAPASALTQLLQAALATVDRWTLEDLGPPHGPFPAAASAAPGVERGSAAPGVERAARLSLR